MNKRKVLQVLAILVIGGITGLLFGSCMVHSDEKVYSDKPLIIGDNPVDEVFVIDSNTEFYHSGGIMVTGRGTLIVKGTLYQNGHVYITENGTFHVDGGAFHIDGYDTNVYVDENGSCIFNHGLLHYVQEYVSQHNLAGGDNGYFEFVNSQVDCDGSIEFIHLVGNASYTAIDTVFADWTTWYLHDHTTLSLENVNYAGDIVLYDSPTLTFVNCDFVMPWLYFGEGAVIDYTFSGSKGTTTTTIDNTVPGISGIPWSLTMENCSHVAWGVNPYPGSDVTIKDSQLTMVLFRFAGEGEFDLQGIMKNDSYYKNKVIPVTDRMFQLINTSVKWWKVDVIDNFQLYADSIVFSEMVLKDSSKAFITQSVCEGQTIHLGAQDNSFVYFEQGEIWSYVSVWGNAVMVLKDSLVDWQKGEFIYQTSNIAHGNSRLYCLNCVMRSDPWAVDSALVMVESLTGLDRAKIGEKIVINGSAWIDTGSDSSITFAKYNLSWSKNGSDWTLITESVNPVQDGILGEWDTSKLTEGEYKLRLQIWVNGDTSSHPPDKYPVLKTITLFSDGLQDDASPESEEPEEPLKESEKPSESEKLPKEPERSGGLLVVPLILIGVIILFLLKRKRV
ncbi:MAG: hypothetical protein PVF58_15980 [Candidatus Methanofastidiosia archaeon]